jgi:hypothetical protein
MTHRTTITPDNVAIIRERQKSIRREVDRRGIALKAVSFDSAIPYETLLTYFPQPGSRDPAQIPGGAIFALCEGEALPLDLLSLLLPGGFLIVKAPEAVDHDEIEAACRDYLAAKGAAHRADSPSGPEIADCEDSTLNGKVAHLRAVAA